MLANIKTQEKELSWEEIEQRVWTVQEIEETAVPILFGFRILRFSPNGGQKQEFENSRATIQSAVK